MQYGVPLNVKETTILKNGYIIIPTHCESSLQVDVQYITPWVNHARFHIIKEGKQCFIHQDKFIDDEGHRTYTKKTPEILKEIKRLNCG